MSIFSDLSKNLLSWGLQTARTEAQTVGFKAIQDAMNQLNTVAAKHCPDVAPLIQPVSQQLVAALVAGLATKSK